MSATIPMEEAQAKLKESIGKLTPGEEVVITEGQRPVAKLVAAPACHNGIRAGREPSVGPYCTWLQTSMLRWRTPREP